MLSRLAESLYWIGRYVERAEDTSRILDVHLTLLLDDPWAPEDVVCASLLSAMGAELDGPVNTADVLDLLAWDKTDPASILGSIAVARENARRSREVISTELWESINVTWHDSSRTSRRGRPHAFFTWVRERAAAFNGTADATLSRDEAYHFLALGRSIERADMTARLVAARALAGDAGPSWVTLLSELRRLPGVPAQRPRCSRRSPGGRVPAARPAVPAFDDECARHRRTLPRRARRSGRPAQPGVERGGPGTRDDPVRARVRAARRSCSTTSTT